MGNFCLSIVFGVTICLLLYPDEKHFISGFGFKSVVQKSKSLTTKMCDRLRARTPAKTTAPQLSDDEKDAQRLMGYVEEIDRTVRRVHQAKFERLKNFVLKVQSQNILKKYGELVRHRLLSK